MAADPIFIASVRSEYVEISTANTARDGTGTIGTVFTAGASGSKVTSVTIKAESTTTAGMIRLFVYNGSTYALLKEFTVDAITPSGTVASYERTYNPDLILHSGWSLRASTNNAEVFNVIALGGDY